MQIKQFIEKIREQKEALERLPSVEEAIGSVRAALKIEELIPEAARTGEDLKEIEVELFGKKGLISLLRKRIPAEAPEKRKDAGRALNELNSLYQESFNTTGDKIAESEHAARLRAERIDVTMPGRRPGIGREHPISSVTGEIVEIFRDMGFSVAEGPEVELDYYNFEALNMPKDHPARDMQDTFYVTDEVVLRTHTSPVQVRVMRSKRPPVQVIAPGKVYRCDADVSHTPMFHQVEGLLVDRHITFAHLKGVLEAFIGRMFGEDTATRFRPSFFPFTEPSAEVDIKCVICGGSGCRVCKNSGWLEILGSGMVDPEVFRAVGYDPEEYTGFAFGMGVERIAMLKYGIDDIRLFYENDLRFIRQF
ncbi:MAG: phenylalanine--tRNA ligase subunit alpha [Nitrospirota bacterium]